MDIYLFRTDHLGAYNDIFRVLVTLVVMHLYVSAATAFFSAVRQSAANLSEVS